MNSYLSQASEFEGLLLDRLVHRPEQDLVPCQPLLARFVGRLGLLSHARTVAAGRGLGYKKACQGRSRHPTRSACGTRKRHLEIGCLFFVAERGAARTRANLDFYDEAALLLVPHRSTRAGRFVEVAMR